MEKTILAFRVLIRDRDVSMSGTKQDIGQKKDTHEMWLRNIFDLLKPKACYLAFPLFESITKKQPKS